MGAPTGFRLPRVCLPRSDIDLAKWAVVACDQYTSEPDYWADVARAVGEAPSTLQLIFPEVFLGKADVPERIARVQATMRRYLAEGLLRDHDGAIYVERTDRAARWPAAAARPDAGARPRALRLQRAASASLIRPTEGAVVERLAPHRGAQRRRAASCRTSWC